MSYIIEQAPNGDIYAEQAHGGLTQRKRIELWRAFTSHLIGLATVLWWVWFKEAPPK